jgi:hypothetical protein
MKIRKQNVFPYVEDMDRPVNPKDSQYFDEVPKVESVGNMECASVLLYKLSPLIINSKNPKVAVLLLMFHFGMDLRDIIKCGGGDDLASVARHLKLSPQTVQKQYRYLREKLAAISESN